MKRLPQIAALIGTCLFISSLLLPAIEFTVFQNANAAPGWAAFMAALLSLKDVGTDIRSAPLAMAAVGNFIFFVGPSLAFSKKRRRKILALFPWCAAAALLLALASPYTLEGNAPILLIGYDFWIAGMAMMLITALLLRFTGPSLDAGTHVHRFFRSTEP